MRCSFSTSAKRTWPSPPGAEPGAGADRDLRLAQEPQRERLRALGAERLGHLGPDEHRALRRLHRPASAGEAAAEPVPPGAVELADLERVLRRLVHGHDRRDLDRLEGAVVEIGLQSPEPREHLRVAEGKPDAPAGHRKALRQGVQLDGDFARAFGPEDRRRLVAVVGEVGVREVVDDEELALACEVDDLLHQLRCRDRTRRVVREGDDERPGLDAGAAVRGVELRHEVAAEAEALDGGAGEQRREAVDRVARVGHERDVTGLDEHPHQVREPLLGADRRDRLPLRIELDAEAAAVEVADRTAQVGDAAAGRVAVVARVPRGLRQLLDGHLGGGNIGIPEPEVDHVLARTAQFRASPARPRRRRTAAARRPGGAGSRTTALAGRRAHGRRLPQAATS